MHHPTITSPQNPKIRHVIALEKPRERRKQGLFVVEGVKETLLAIRAGYRISNVFFCEDLITQNDVEAMGLPAKVLIPVSREVFDKIAVRENSGGVVAVAEQKGHHLGDIRLRANPLVLVLESVEKPGNLGAILRTADAANLDAVIICDPQTDFYNPNVIRSSIGCVFTVPVAAATSAEAIAWLKTNHINIYCTWLQASKPYHHMDYTLPSAIVMGTESTGLSGIWVSAATSNIIIPMQGSIDSMNVSTAAAVVVFEAKRQRGYQD